MIRGYVGVVGLLLFSCVTGCSVNLGKKMYGNRFYIRHHATTPHTVTIERSNAKPLQQLKQTSLDRVDVIIPSPKIAKAVFSHTASDGRLHPVLKHRNNRHSEQCKATDVSTDDPDDIGRSNLVWFAALSLILVGTATLLLSGLFVPIWMIGVAVGFWLASLIVLLAGKKIRKNNDTQTGVLIVIMALALVGLAVAAYILWHAIRLIIAIYGFLFSNDD